MIEIDGSTGHGGGQIIRTAVALSAITGKPFKINNIRSGRPNPGLKPQHIQGIRAVASLCNARVQGDKQNSTELDFAPGKLEPKDLKVDTGTAGSISLVLQTLLLPCMQANKPIRISVRGGTDVKWSPPVDYLSNVTLPLLNKLGFKAECTLEQRGYYPKGGGIAETTTSPSKPKRVKLVEKGRIVSIKGLSHASKNLENARVAERQAKEARKALSLLGIKPQIKTEYCNTKSVGSGIQLWIETENSVLGGNALGEKGKPAEQVGKQAAETLLEQYEKGVVDEWSADQLIPYLALTGNSQILVSKITEHCKTNISIVEQFTNKKLKAKDQLIKVN